MARNHDTHKSKISSEFAARLARLKPGQNTRVVVILQTGPSGEKSSRRLSRTERQTKSKALQKAAESALAEIDDVLARYGGTRLTTRINALGSIPVETTADGIRALAASGHVKVILEDQPIRLTSDARAL